MKKIIFIVFIVFLSIIVNNILDYNSQVIINFSDYQIITTSSFLLFIFISIVFSLYVVLYITTLIFYPNVNNYRKKCKNLEKNFNKYIELISEAFIYKSARNLTMATLQLKKANKIFQNTNLSKLLETQIYYLNGDYIKSEKCFKEIKDYKLNVDLLNLRINLEQAKKENNQEKMQKYAEELIKIEPINKTASEILLNIYINNKQWNNAYDIINFGLKSKIFTIEKIEDKILFVFTSFGKQSYDNGNFILAKHVLRTVYKIDKNYIQCVILLVKTYIALGKILKAIQIIKKTWSYNTNPYLLRIYLSLLNDKDRKSIKTAENLYKINSKSYESNLFLAKTYLNNQLYSQARKYAKHAEAINETKSLYEIMLKIEQEDNGSSAVIANLKQKINDSKNSTWKCSVCGKEYSEWQPNCEKCGNVDKIEWYE